MSRPVSVTPALSKTCLTLLSPNFSCPPITTIIPPSCHYKPLPSTPTMIYTSGFSDFQWVAASPAIEHRPQPYTFGEPMSPIVEESESEEIPFREESSGVETVYISYTFGAPMSPIVEESETEEFAMSEDLSTTKDVDPVSNSSSSSTSRPRKAGLARPRPPRRHPVPWGPLIPRSMAQVCF